MRNIRLIPSVSVVLLFLFSGITAEAQLLKKLSKGLEKINKTVENVDKALKGKNTSNNSTSNNPSSGSNGNVASPAGNIEQNEGPEDNYSGEAPEFAGAIEAPTPYLTPNTLYLEARWTLLDNVSDSVFWVTRGEGSWSFKDKYEFWKTDGTKLFDAEWEPTSSAQPIFNGGVVPMRKASGNAYKKGPVCLLYSDGRIKNTGEVWAKVTNFMDGVAVAVPNLGSGEGFFIDTTGKRVYPNIKLDGTAFNMIRPLRDGLRAYRGLREGWGYIDKNGVVKLSPKYKEAREFSEGYAWVQMDDNSRHLIDKTGKSVFRAPDSVTHMSDVVNGIFYMDEVPSTVYYDVKGNRLDSFELGNQFYGGYAFVSRPKEYGDVNTLLIDTAMNVVKEISWTLVDVGMVSEKLPKFPSSGLANVNNPNIGGNSYLMCPDASIALAGFNNNREVVVHIDGFEPVADCGYFVARIYIELDAWKSITGAAIVKTSGEVVYIVSEDKEFGQIDYGRGYPVRKSDLDANGGSITIKTADINQAPVGKFQGK